MATKSAFCPPHFLLLFHTEFYSLITLIYYQMFVVEERFFTRLTRGGAAGRSRDCFWNAVSDFAPLALS